MLNMSIILFRYKQFDSKIYNAISMYYFLYKLITDLQNSIHFITGLLLYKHKLTAAWLKKGSAQWFRLANSASTFINLSSYEYKSYAKKFGSVRFGKKNRRFGSVRVRQKIPGSVVSYYPPSYTLANVFLHLSYNSNYFVIWHTSSPIFTNFFAVQQKLINIVQLFSYI